MGKISDEVGGQNIAPVAFQRPWELTSTGQCENPNGWSMKYNQNFCQEGCDAHARGIFLLTDF